MALQIEGTAWVFGDDINTDLILPGAAFLLPVEEQIKYCFSANRPGWKVLCLTRGSDGNGGFVSRIWSWPSFIPNPLLWAARYCIRKSTALGLRTPILRFGLPLA